MNTYTQTLPLNKLQNIEYPEKSLTFFISNLTEFHFNEIIPFKRIYPSITINIVTTGEKLLFLYKNSVDILTRLERNKINISLSKETEEDTLIIDNTTRIPLIYIYNSINLNTSKISYIDSFDLSTVKYHVIDNLFSHSNDSYINTIKNLSSSDIERLLDSLDYSNLELNSHDIPQFSNFDNSSINLINILSNIETPLKFNDIGLLLTEGSKKDAAYKKYGENQSKTAELLELVSISSKVPKIVSLTSLGENLLLTEKSTFEKIIFFQILKCNLIKHLISLCKTYDEVNVKKICLNVLSEKTYVRRRSNIKFLVNILKSQESTELNFLLNKLTF